jgi:hypothetical protein
MAVIAISRGAPTGTAEVAADNVKTSQANTFFFMD